MIKGVIKLLNRIRQFFCIHKYEKYSYFSNNGLIKTICIKCSKCGKIIETHQLKYNGITYE